MSQGVEPPAQLALDAKRLWCLTGKNVESLAVEIGCLACRVVDVPLAAEVVDLGSPDVAAS